MNNKPDKNIIIYLCLVFGLFSADELIKLWVEESDTFSEKEILNGNIALERLRNKGAASGLLKDRPGLLKIVSGVILIAAIIRMIMLCKMEGHALEKTGMALVLGGALSNISDRFVKGFVTDYFKFKKAPGILGKLVFNISDMNIIAGSVITTAGRLTNNE